MVYNKYFIKSDSDADDFFDETSDQNNDPLYNNKSFTGASIGIGVILIIGEMIYYLNGEVNIQDYVYSNEETLLEVNCSHGYYLIFRKHMKQSSSNTKGNILKDSQIGIKGSKLKIIFHAAYCIS
jgi:hypothetical protein